MVYYRRWGRRWRRPRYRRRYWRRRQPRTRRRTVRTRRRRKFRSRKRNVIFWQPPNRVTCKIRGWTLGVNASNNTPVRDTISRVYKTWIDESTGNSVISYEGGGVNCIIFSLEFLWQEYQLFHNWWSNTNDGHDLARYFGTDIYLQPHRFVDYVFWWDTDWQKYTNEHFLRCHPANIMSWKTKVFVRSQWYGGNHKTKRVRIRPPATLTNQWKHMNDFFHIPLFTGGVSIVDWVKWFSQEKMSPQFLLPKVCTARITAEGQVSWQYNSGKSFYYMPFYDSGVGNRLWVAMAPKTSAMQTTPSTATPWKEVMWAVDLPYWMSFYGQNKTWDMGVIKKSEYENRDNIADNNTNTLWFRIIYPIYETITQANTGGGERKFIAWKIQTYVNILQETQLTINHGLAYCGPFVQADNTDYIEIPIFYKSRWQWGGQVYSNMEIINPQHFSKQSISVKNPQTVARSIIYPWDTGASGLLTEQALRRLVEPSTTVEERRPQPWAQYTKDDPVPEEYEETGSEAEESEDESDEEPETSKALRILRKRLQREQLKRRKLFHFFRFLLKSKQIQRREGASPLPPPYGGPPYPTFNKGE
nr:ORF1 [Torque teno felis virus]